MEQYDEYGLAKNERMEIRMSAARSAAEVMKLNAGSAEVYKKDVIVMAALIEKFILDGYDR